MKLAQSSFVAGLIIAGTAVFVSMLQQLGLEIDSIVSSTRTMRGLEPT